MKGASGPEAIPQMPVLPNLPQVPDSKIEASVEKVDTPKEQQTQSVNTTQPNPVSTQTTTPKVAVVEPKKNKPYGDGFEPTTFDWKNPKAVEEFIEKNKNSDTTLSSTWAANAWEKYILEENNRV
jgi:hypothetical protein